jgi:hypothetical protein
MGIQALISGVRADGRKDAMRGDRWITGPLGALGLVVMLAVAGIAPSADALVGTSLRTVTVPAAAQCPSGATFTSGSALAVVPGGKLNFPKFNSLLVTSCVVNGQAKLFFLDPSTEPATLVSTLDTTVSPTAGRESLALRSDKVDLIGCGMVGGSPKIYSIDFNKITPNTTVDGTATLLFTGPAGSTCQGLAWDGTSSPKTIYQSSSGAPPNDVNDLLHLSEAGSSSIGGSVPSGCAGPLTGVAVGVVSAETPAFSGSVLYVACPAAGESVSVIRQLDKANGNPVTSVEIPTGLFALPTTQPGDVECDPVTFAVSQSWHPTIRNKDVLWVKDTGPLTPHRVHAMELPFAACGPVPPPPTAAANVCDLNLDTDGDGLPDCWEDGITWWHDDLPGIALDGLYTPNRTATSTNRHTLCVEANGITGFQPIECADKLNRDVFVEIDYMQHHQPRGDAVSDVIAAFGMAPAFRADSGKCDGAGCTSGVRLHVQVDEQIPHVTNTALFPCTGPFAAGHVDFDAIKKGTAFQPPAGPVGGFGTLTERASSSLLNAKRLSFHYGLFVHNQSPTPPSTSNSSSGCAELFGNDFMVAMGSWTPPSPAITGHTGGVGSRSEQAGTFMHELGHNLGLRHGGVDNVNCKPHHVSVMNYTYQFPNSVPDRPLSFSPLLGVAAPLTCGMPNPPGTPPGLNEACLDELQGIGTLYTGKIAYGPLTGIPAKPTIATAGAAINWDRDTNAAELSVSRDLTGLTGSGGGCPTSATREFLEGSDDWAIVQLNLRASTDFLDGVTASFDPSLVDGTVDVSVEDALALSGDIIDIKPDDPNNTVKVASTATINVAIFSREGVDTTTIAPDTVTLRGLPPGPEWVLYVRRQADCKVKDVNKDGLADLECKFQFLPDTPRVVGTQKAVLTGTTDESYDFHGSDSVRFIP